MSRISRGWNRWTRLSGFRLVWLLANLAALGLIAFFIGGSGCSEGTQTQTSSPPDSNVAAQHSGSSTPSPGETNTTTISATTTSGKRDSQVTYIWIPPFDFIQAFRFPGRQPDNPTGPPPFVFSGVPLVSATQYESVPVEFDWPALPAGLSSMRGVETIRLLVPGNLGEPNPIHFFYTLTASSKSGSHPDDGKRVAPVAPRDASTYDYLAYERWIDGNTMMIPSLCEKYVDAFNSGEFFYAIRLPAVAVPGSPDAYTLPFASYGENIRSRLELENWSSQPVTGFVATLKRAPQELTCLENELPGEPGMHWLALEVEPPVQNNCAAFPITDRWSVMLRLYFQREILERELLTYACYRGVDPQIRSLCSQAATVLGLELIEQNANGCCLTCFGPTPMKVSQDFSQMELHNTGVEPYFQPRGERIAFRHLLINAPAPATLAYEFLGERQDLEGGFYQADNGQYNLAQPITQASAGVCEFWFVSEPITAQTPKGLYLMKILATTNSRAQVWTTDFVNVGELLGALNQDEQLDAVDMLLLANVLADNLPFDSEWNWMADLDFNCRVDVSDLLLLEVATTH